MTHRARAHNPWRIPIQVAPTAVAALLLVAAASGRAINVHDEGHFLLAAHTIAEGVRGVLAGDSIPELRDAIHRGGGTLYFAAKPGYIALLAFLDLLTGGLTSGRALALSILSAIGMVALTQSVATKRFGWRVGLLAGLLVAWNPLALQFGRMALGVGPAVSLALLAFWIMEGSAKTSWRAALGGALAFVAFACHYNVAPLLLALGIGCWPQWIRSQRIGLIAGGVGAALVFEGVLLAVDFMLRSSFPEFRSFFGELYYNFAVHQVAGGESAVLAAGAAASTDGVRGYGPAAWRYLAATLAGGFHWMLLAAVMGLVWMTRESIVDRPARRQMLWWVLFPLAAWSLYPWKVERSFLSVLPGVAVAAALCLERFRGRWHQAGEEGQGGRFWTALGWFPLAMVLLTAGVLCVPVLSPAPSGHRRLVMNHRDWIANLEPGAFTATSFNWRSAPVWKWYLGPELRRLGVETSGVDFSSFEMPRFAARDPVSDLPDPGYSAQQPEFENAREVLSLQDMPEFCFIARLDD